MSPEEVVALAAQLVEALGPEPDEETSRAAYSWNEDEGRPKNQREIEATEPQRSVVAEWRRLVENAELFLCETVDWRVPVLRAAEALAPPERWGDDEAPDFDRWTIILWARMTAWCATADPLEHDEDTGSTRGETLAGHFARQCRRAGLDLSPSAFRPCDRVAALDVFDRVLAEGPGDLIDGHRLSPEEAERARLDLMMFEPTGRDERGRVTR
jgi:hypothetical protein